MDSKKKFNVKTAGFILIIFLLILLFASRTIYTYRLPIVTGTSPFNGKLNKTEKSKGLANIEKTTDLYTDAGGKVEEVYAKDGELVTEGQELFKMSFDRDDIQQSLKELEVNRSKMVNEISAANIKRQNNEKHIQFLKDETYTLDTLSDYDIKQTEKEIEVAEEDLKNKEILYHSGALTKIEYENAKNVLDTLKDKKAELLKTYEDSFLKQTETHENKEKTKQQQIQDYMAENELLKKEINLNQLNINGLNIQKETLEKKLLKFNANEIIYAKESGKLLSFDVKKGQKLQDHYFIGSIGIGNRYEIECSLSLDNNFTVVGDTCKLKNANHSFEGYVSNIKLSKSNKIATVLVESEEISLGETFDVAFEKESGESYVLVPNGALNVDSDGYFLYQIKRRDGIIGKEFYTQKLRVYIGDNDDKNTAITKGVSFFEPVALYSNKPFTEGQTIYLSNVGDFFED